MMQVEPPIDNVEVNAIYWRERRERQKRGPHTSNYLFKSNDHPGNALSQMSEMREHGDLCNVELHAKGGTVLKAHRLVLAACSPFFQAMFRADLIERRSGVVHLDTMDGDVMEQLVEFCYTSRIEITEDNVQRLLPTADLLQMSKVGDGGCGIGGRLLAKYRDSLTGMGNIGCKVFFL